MLNITTLDLEPISEADICLFFEKGVRSGFSYISQRHSKLKKRYLKSYDPKQESNHITYLETNNLYDYAMLKILPTGGFKQIYLKEFDSNKYSSNSLKGSVLEVDLEYPKELHELHNYYPLAPDKLEIKN